jgi:hypothetical protein
LLALLPGYGNAAVKKLKNRQRRKQVCKKEHQVRLCTPQKALGDGQDGTHASPRQPQPPPPQPPRNKEIAWFGAARKILRVSRLLLGNSLDVSRADD